MKLIVGLGNPGNKYQFTRHNIGFIAVDALAEIWELHSEREDHQALVRKGSVVTTTTMAADPGAGLSAKISAGGDQHSGDRTGDRTPDRKRIIGKPDDKPDLKLVEKFVEKLTVKPVSVPPATRKVEIPHTVMLAKPQTFMNRSGQSVQGLMAYYQVAPTEMLVIHDDIDLPFGAMRFQMSRGAGGHNGIRDVHEKLGHSDYPRLKMGVGRPSHPGHAVVDYVLEAFSKVEQEQLPNWLGHVHKAVEVFLDKGFKVASNEFNSFSL